MGVEFLPTTGYWSVNNPYLRHSAISCTCVISGVNVGIVNMCRYMMMIYDDINIYIYRHHCICM